MSSDKQYIWVYDDNRRIYRTDDAGNRNGSPITREHYRKVELVRETKVSVYLPHGVSIKKNATVFGGLPKILRTEQEVAQVSWVDENRHRIAEALRECRSYEYLKRVADELNVKTLE